MTKMYTHTHAHTHTHTHTHAFNGPLSGTTRDPGELVPERILLNFTEPIWILLKQETVSGSGISWVICKSAPRSRQITMPASHHSVFTGWMPFLHPNQQRQSTEGQMYKDVQTDIQTQDYSTLHASIELCGKNKSTENGKMNIKHILCLTLWL